MHAQCGFVIVAGEGDAIHRADVNAGIAFDAGVLGEHGLHVAIEAALGFLEGRAGVEAQFHFDRDAFQRLHLFLQRHLEALVAGNFVVVAPLVDAHLLRDHLQQWVRALSYVFAVEELVDRDGRVVAVRDRPDDVLGSERRVAAEEYIRQARLQRHLVHHRHAPFVEGQADVALDPGEMVFLTHRDQHVIAFHENSWLAGRYQAAPALFIAPGLDLFKIHADQLAVAVLERFRHHEIQDRDAFVDGVFLFPGRGLHLVETGTHDHLHVFAAESA